MGENTVHQSLYQCPMQSYLEIDSEVSLRGRRASGLSYGLLNSTRRSHGRLGSTLTPKKSLSKDPRHEGKTTGCILQPAHSLGVVPDQQSSLLFVTVSNTSQKMTPTANFSFHRHQNTKGTLWTCWLFSQKLVRTSWNREDMEGLCIFSGSWLSQKHTSWVCCGGVTQLN